MPAWKDVTAMALKLPKTGVSTWYGTLGVKVAGKGFLRLRTEAWRRKAPIKLLKDFDAR